MMIKNKETLEQRQKKLAALEAKARGVAAPVPVGKPIPIEDVITREEITEKDLIKEIKPRIDSKGTVVNKHKQEVGHLSKEAQLEYVLKTPELWIKNFIRIVDKKGELIPFNLNEQQQHFMDKKDKQNIILKARQLGFSTLTCALALYHACTKPNTHCLLVSYSQDSASALFDKLKSMYDTIPEPMKPALFTKNKKELAMKNGSKVICATAGLKDIGRGMTITFCHLSEFAFWRDNADALLLGLEQSMTPNGTLVIESTANGMNYFSELWNNKNSYKKMFYSWWEDKSMFIEEWDLYEKMYLAQNDGKYPVGREWTDYERALLAQGALIKQLLWRRIKIQNMGYEGIVKFKQEFPSSPTEAFQTTGHSLFDNETITEQSLAVRNPIDLETLRELANEETNWQIEEFKRFPKELLDYVMSGELIIWELPKYRNKYYFGCDFSEGVGVDSTVLYGTNFNCDSVCQFTSNRLNPRVIADALNLLGRYYNFAYLVIERASSGPTAIDVLRNEHGYMNMHKHKMADERGKRRSQVGFITSQKSKIQIINDLRMWFNENEFITDSQLLLKEMSTFIVTDSGRMEASGTNHDDHVMAAAMCLHGVKTGIWYA